MNKERARLSSGATDEHSPGIQERKGQDFFFLIFIFIYIFAALGLSRMRDLPLRRVDSPTVAHGLTSCGAQA